MGKRLICKPAPEIELVLDGGDIVLLRFDVYMISELQAMDGGLGGMFKQSMPEMAVRVVYAAAKNQRKDFEFEDARRIISCMSIDSIQAIMDEFSDSIGETKNIEQKELSKNLMAQFLQSLK